MTDEQFDDRAKEAFAYDSGPPNERVWNKVKPVRWQWLPTVREILLCGSVAAMALLMVGARMRQNRPIDAQPNPMIQAAMHDETRFVLSSVTRIPGSSSVGG